MYGVTATEHATVRSKKCRDGSYVLVLSIDISLLVEYTAINETLKFISLKPPCLSQSDEFKALFRQEVEHARATQQHWLRFVLALMLPPRPTPTRRLSPRQVPTLPLAARLRVRAAPAQAGTIFSLNFGGPHHHDPPHHIPHPSTPHVTPHYAT